MVHSAFVAEVATLVATAYGSGGNPMAPVAMPVSAPPAADTETPQPTPWGQVGPFGLFGAQGQRMFRRSLEIASRPGQTLELLSMCAGELQRVPAGYLAGPTRTRQGVSHLTRRNGLLVKVSPIGPILGRLREAVQPAAILELPEPRWVVFEHDDDGFSPDPALERTAIWEVLDGFPIDVPAEGDTYANLPADVAERFDPALAAIADRLAADPLSLEVCIEGHTDTTGRESDNVALSERRAGLIQQQLATLVAERDDTLEPDDWMAILETAGMGETDPWFVRDADEARRAANRRVEIKARLPLEVSAGQRLGTLTGTLSVTVLDGIGRVLDPLDLVRRYDTFAEFVGHPLAIMRSLSAPAIASGWVHCLSPDPAGDAATEEDQQFFAFPDAGLSGENPLAAALAGPDPVEAGDIVWLADQDPGSAPIPTEITIDRAISIVSSGATLVGRPIGDLGATAADDPMIRIVAPVPADVGVRLLLLRMTDGRSIVTGGGAVHIDDADNVHIANCTFEHNEVSLSAGSGPLVGAGGAIHLTGSRQILIEDCVFRRNRAADGGAIYAADCRGLVVAGAPLAPPVAQTFAQFLADPDATRSTEPALDPLRSDNYRTRFELNRAQDHGGALLLSNTTFRLENCGFAMNRADVAGGALAAYADDSAKLTKARDAVAVGDQPVGADHVVQSCLIRENHAAAGAAVALGGQQRDPRLQAQGAGGSAGGGLFEIVGNIITDNVWRDMQPADVCSMGAGLCLASGVFTVRRNRISDNRCRGYGGAVAAVGNARVELIENVIDKNGAGLGPFPDPPGDLGVPGGGAVYARGFGGEPDTAVSRSVPAGSLLPRADRTVIRLLDNVIQQNESFRDGAGVLATGGAIVVVGNNAVERSASATVAANLFQANNALWNGGAISIRNADLEIWAGEGFFSNEAGRDGGALFVGGTLAYLTATVAQLAAEAVSSHTRRLPAGRGARLVIAGSIDEPVIFSGNRAGSAGQGHGGAVFVYQQPVTRLVVPPLAGNFSVGILRSVAVHYAKFVANRSVEDESGTIGSTIATLGLDHGWRPEYPSNAAEAIVSALDEILGDEGLGPYALENLDLALDRGIGIYLMNSEAPDVELRFQSGNWIRHSAGAPEGQGWESVVTNANVTRPMEP